MPNLRLIARGLARTPLFTLTAVASLALGIGANTAIFSLLDRVLLQTIPVKAPHELAFLYHPGPSQGSVSTDEPNGPSFSYPVFRTLQAAAPAPFVGIAGARAFGVSLSYDNQAGSGSAHLVSGNYFALLGVTPAIGRVFDDGDDRTPGGHPVAVLGHGYWTSRFGGDASVLNRPLVVNGLPLTIVGVAQKGFGSETPGRVHDVFVPISMRREITPDWNGFANRVDYWVTLFGRLAPGATREQGAAALNQLYRGELEQDIAAMTTPEADFLRQFRAKQIVLREGQYGRGTLRERGRTPLLLLMGMTLLVLLIACANVANLQLTRAAGRVREIAVRLALGASRRRLVAQLLAESCLLAIAGGVAGLLVAYWTVRGIAAAMPQRALIAGVVESRLDLRVLLFALALSVLTGILFGLYPALQGARADVTSALKDQAGQGTPTRAAGFFRKSLVTMQTAISLLLLVCAGLLSRTLVNLTHVDLGIRVDQLITFAVDPKLNRYTDERTAQFNDQLVERLAALPGVTLVSAARVAAIAGSSSSGSITVEGVAPTSNNASAHGNAVGPGYFRTLGIPLVAGREIAQADDVNASKVALVNEAFVRKYFGSQNPLGRRLVQARGPNVTLDTTIVGVVKDSKYASLRESTPPVVYTAYRQTPRGRGLNFYVRTAIDPEQAAPAIRRAVASLDPHLPIRDLRTMQAQIDDNVANERLLSRLVGVFGVLATVLAAIGLYGVLAYNVARRTREIGIRMALGADARRVRSLVVRDVALVLGIGIVAGLASAAAVGRLFRAILFELQPWDPFVYTAAAIALGLIALAAAWLPAHRATGVDPMVALRYE